MRSYPVKESPIGSAVSKILRYKHTHRQTNRHPVTLLLRYGMIVILLKFHSEKNCRYTIHTFVSGFSGGLGGMAPFSSFSSGQLLQGKSGIGREGGIGQWRN